MKRWCGTLFARAAALAWGLNPFQGEKAAYMVQRFVLEDSAFLTAVILQRLGRHVTSARTIRGTTGDAASHDPFNHPRAA